MGIVLVLLAFLIPACSRQPQSLRIFHAAGLTPVLEEIRPWVQSDLGITLLAEGSGSQAACRKLTELGRPCDLLMLADAPLVGELCRSYCSWRLDFASDEMVLGVGSRAPWIPDAEANWQEVLLGPDVRLARADPALSPIGYRTLLVLRLTEQTRPTSGLLTGFLARCRMVVDDVARLPPLLRSGEIDYAFLYRSTAWAHNIRHIPLDPRVNLGSPTKDYSGAEVTYELLQAGARQTVTVRGAPITWTLTVPDAATNAAAFRFIAAFLAHEPDPLVANGMKPLEPARFYGPSAVHDRLFPRTTYGGPLP